MYKDRIGTVTTEYKYTFTLPDTLTVHFVFIFTRHVWWSYIYPGIIVFVQPPGETRGIHVNSTSLLFKTRRDLAEFTWFVR